MNHETYCTAKEIFQREGKRMTPRMSTDEKDDFSFSTRYGSMFTKESRRHDGDSISTLHVEQIEYLLALAKEICCDVIFDAYEIKFC